MTTYTRNICTTTRELLTAELAVREYVHAHAADVAAALDRWDGKQFGKRMRDFIARECPGFYVTLDGRNGTVWYVGGVPGLPGVPGHIKPGYCPGFDVARLGTTPDGRKLDASRCVVYDLATDHRAAEIVKLRRFLDNPAQMMDAINRAAAGYIALYEALPGSMRDNRRYPISEQARYLPIPF